ncbi:MAG: Putative aminopeptidase YsdC [uncultured marine phage]|uniref:Aminopeptidase YsdC n=1 Tax=uncultured marine phage TaxID=707152 RepID=A0A8D9FQL8_9VIRU|nr:MAG: Putative aminopeptidase YsdC [uncultured marine phage]
MEIYNEESMEFLHKYLNNPSPSGFEREGQKIWVDYIKPFVDEIRVDNYGSVVGVINPEAEHKVVIEAHADEIGWTVKYIATNGLIYVEKLGGSDVALAPGSRVNIHTKNGTVEGVFGAPAVHLRGKDWKPMINTLSIDVGVLKQGKAEELGIEVGDPITFQDGFKVMNGQRFVGRGLDNRIGGFMIAQVARLLKENEVELPFGLYICNAVQEEVGKNGAKMLAESIKPDIAIVTDVTHDTSTPGINTVSRGDFKISRGPVLTSAPPVQKKLLATILETADEHEIKYQKKTAAKVTGTDADVFAYSNGGIPTALISLPMRYMHTAVETVSKYDVDKVTKLIYRTLETLDPETRYNTLD